MSGASGTALTGSQRNRWASMRMPPRRSTDAFAWRGAAAGRTPLRVSPVTNWDQSLKLARHSTTLRLAGS